MTLLEPLSKLPKDGASIQDAVTLTLEDGRRLLCTHLNRRVGNKRWVVFGQLLVDGQAPSAQPTAVIKIYAGSGAARRAKRCRRGSLILASGGNAAPAELAFGSSFQKGPPLWVLAQELLAGANSLHECMSQDASEVDYQHALRQHYVAIAQQHNAGIDQQDSFANNYMLLGQVVYGIDGDHVEQMAGPVPVCIGLKRLAHASHFCSVRRDYLLRDAFQHYCLARGMQYRSAEFETMLKLLARLRQHRAKRWAGKHLKQFVRSERIAAWHVLIAKDMASSAGLQTLLAHNQLQSYQPLVDGSRYLSAEGEQFYIYSANDSWYWLCWRGRLGRRVWLQYWRLRRLHVPTYEPLALATRRRSWLGMQSYVIARVLTKVPVGQVSVTHPVTHASPAELQQYPNAQIALFRLMQSLSRLGWWGRGWRATHVQLQADQVQLAGVDRLRQGGWRQYWPITWRLLGLLRPWRGVNLVEQQIKHD